MEVWGDTISWKFGKLLLAFVVSRHTRLYHLLAVRLPTDCLIQQGFQSMDFRMTSLYIHHPISTVPQKKTWWKRNVQRFWFFKKKRISPFLDDTLLLQNAYSATQVNSDPQGKGFLCKKKKECLLKQIGWFFIPWFMTHHFIHSALFVLVEFCPCRYETANLQWPDYGLTMIRLRAYRCNTMIIQWSCYGLALIRLHYDLTVIRLRPHNDQTTYL